MVDVSLTIEGTEEVLHKLRGLSAELRGGPEIQSAFKAVGMAVQEDQRREFDERAEGGTTRGVSWKPLSMWTVLWRRGIKARGDAGPDRTAIALIGALFSDLQGKGARPLQDTGRLRAAWTASSKRSGDAVLKTGGLSVEVGVAVDYAAFHHRGGSKALDYGFVENEGLTDLRNGWIPTERNALLSSHLSVTLPGGNPKPRGRKKSIARRHWNPAFFVVRNVLRKQSGRSVQVPARPVLVMPDEGQVRRYRDILVVAVSKAMERMGFKA